MNSRMSKIEKLANKLLKKNKLSPPIDIINFIKKYADVEETDVPFTIDALCHQGGGKPKIILQEDQPPFRKRFTYAHELGHLIIPWHIGTLSCNIDEKSDLVDENLFYSIESEANSFAAEFLAPSYWIKEIIRENNNLDLTQLLNKVSKDAEISLQASMFSLCKHLDKKYLILYKESGKSFVRKLSTEDNDVFIPYINDNYNGVWLNKQANQYDVINKFNYEIYWWDFTYECKDEVIKEIVESYEEYGLTRMITQLSEKLDISFIVSFYKLLDFLPEGYVIYISGNNYSKCFMSPNTRLKSTRDYKNDTYNAEWLDNYSQSSGILQVDEYTLNWWKFNTNIEIIDDIEDIRDSKQILDNMLNEIYMSNEIDTKRRSINGIVGGCNSMHGNNDLTTFTKILKQRFIGREGLIDFIEHMDFDIYIAKKANEMLEKRKNTKK